MGFFEILWNTIKLFFITIFITILKILSTIIQIIRFLLFMKQGCIVFVIIIVIIILYNLLFGA